MDLRDWIILFYRRARCFLGWHFPPVGLVNVRAYDWAKELLDYKSYMGCPHCRRPAPKAEDLTP